MSDVTLHSDDSIKIVISQLAIFTTKLALTLELVPGTRSTSHDWEYAMRCTFPIEDEADVDGDGLRIACIQENGRAMRLLSRSLTGSESGARVSASYQGAWRHARIHVGFPAMGVEDVSVAL